MLIVAHGGAAAGTQRYHGRGGDGPPALRIDSCPARPVLRLIFRLISWTIRVEERRMSQTPPPPAQPPAETSPAGAVAACWGDTAEARRRAPLQGWLDSPLVLREYVHPRLYGRAEGNWLAGISRRLGIPAAGHWLSLGCGGAGAEIGAARDGLFASMVALDVAGRAVEAAERAAAAAGISSIEFGVADLNRPTLPAATYDVVMMSMALHHVAALEALFAAVRTTLKPRGIFLVNEFVGPRQLQFTDLQLAIVRDLLAALPERLRIDSATGQVKSEYVRLPVEHWNLWDPSEAVRSDEIVPLLHRHFEVVLQIDYGGTLLNPLLEHIVHNFDPRNEADVALIRMLARFEELAIRHGVVGNDFAVMAMRVPAAPVRRRWAWRRG
jgi:SAM-dependent methyltransferase